MDINEWAKDIVEKAAAKVEKNKAASELGRKGGLKGGKARAEALSPEKRSKIAKKAAKARWKKVKDEAKAAKAAKKAALAVL